MVINEEPFPDVTTEQQEEEPLLQQPQETSFEVVPPLVDMTPDGLIVRSKEKIRKDLKGDEDAYNTESASTSDLIVRSKERLRKDLKGDEDAYDTESASTNGLIVRSKERLRKDLKGDEAIYDPEAASTDLVSKSKDKLREELEAAKKKKREEKQESEAAITEVTTSLTRSFGTKGHGK